jgi:hypothetical protein
MPVGLGYTPLSPDRGLEGRPGPSIVRVGTVERYRVLECLGAGGDGGRLAGDRYRGRHDRTDSAALDGLASVQCRLLPGPPLDLVRLWPHAPAHGHRVDRVSDGHCRIVFELPLWAPWYVPLCMLSLTNLARICRREVG